MIPNECCLVNYYVLEMLESADNGEPTQKEINELEKILTDKNIPAQHPLLKKYIIYDFPEQKALLIEKDPMLQKAHYVLISNMGFHVDVVTSKEEIFKYTNNNYHAVFSMPYQEGLSDFLSNKQNKFDKINLKMFLYITPEEQEMTDYFSQLGAQTILELPLSTNLLYRALMGEMLRKNIII